MDNLVRLKMEIDGVEILDSNLVIYLEENDLVSITEYIPTSSTNKKQIYKTALSILEDIANTPNTMKNFISEDMSISNFAENLQNRITHLEKKIRHFSLDNSNKNYSSFCKGSDPLQRLEALLTNSVANEIKGI